MYKGYLTCLGVIAQGYADMAYTPAARIAPSEKQQVAGSHLIAAEFHALAILAGRTAAE